MSSQTPDPRFVIVPARRHGWLWAGLIAAFWLASLAALWWFAGAGKAGSAAPTAASPAQTAQAQQQLATLQMSDRISRQANRELQQTLAEREEEIAGLRADVAFYERLVGATGQRKGLNVHEILMRRDNDGSWRYTATLTQNINRGAVTKGDLTLSVEGTRDGKLVRLDWGQLLQKPQAPPQRFEFRYFQRLEGSVLLPQGFVPGRVIARVRADGGGSAEQAFAWDAATAETTQ
ncbi:hypothetical protein M2650_13200 [Luteimonas sp. SX5]|uniref:Transmembrane protein n=1 Tax=Luteimonas galliterrae TaxID=2940486 RepID=A0ABT0ML21_9GAMM|nr:DUF6776 family protein [Luteimonas galliterrae]MCL1635579.1 hypothetical protein [Luteimonas galliterrae]